MTTFPTEIDEDPATAPAWGQPGAPESSKLFDDPSSVAKVGLGTTVPFRAKIGTIEVTEIPPAGGPFGSQANIEISLLPIITSGQGLTQEQFRRFKVGDLIKVWIWGDAQPGSEQVDVVQKWLYGWRTINDIDYVSQTITVLRFESPDRGSSLAGIIGWDGVQGGAPYNEIKTGDFVELDNISHGFVVSQPGVDVSNSEIAHTGNLIFDTSTFINDAMYVVQAGSFVLAGYKHRHDLVFHAGNRTNVSISIADTKPQGKELDIPMVMLQFAVCNSSGHFHPNYADAANSQVLAYMDSVWVKQLNVIGGTLNTEHILYQTHDNTFQADGGQIHSGHLNPEQDPAGEKKYLGRHQMDDIYRSVKPNLRSTIPSNFPDASPTPVTSSVTSWETLARSDVDPSVYDGASDPDMHFKPDIDDYVQATPVYGETSAYNAGANEQQYSRYSPGRTGFWKQKTWGLIYYVDHKKIIVQAFNDKSTSNAMNTGTTTMHRAAHDAGEGDVGRVIASKHSDLTKTIGGKETGGAFNHNLFTTTGSFYEGAGDSIFDYYNVNDNVDNRGPKNAHPVGTRAGYFGDGHTGEKYDATKQEHMPRPYMGGWDNFLWDNVPTRSSMERTWGSISPWMFFSNAINEMYTADKLNGWPLWNFWDHFETFGAIPYRYMVRHPDQEVAGFRFSNIGVGSPEIEAAAAAHFGSTLSGWQAVTPDWMVFPDNKRLGNIEVPGESGADRMRRLRYCFPGSGDWRGEDPKATMWGGSVRNWTGQGKVGGISTLYGCFFPTGTPAEGVLPEHRYKIFHARTFPIQEWNKGAAGITNHTPAGGWDVWEGVPVKYVSDGAYDWMSIQTNSYTGASSMLTESGSVFSNMDKSDDTKIMGSPYHDGRTTVANPIHTGGAISGGAAALFPSKYWGFYSYYWDSMNEASGLLYGRTPNGGSAPYMGLDEREWTQFAGNSQGAFFMESIETTDKSHNWPRNLQHSGGDSLNWTAVNNSGTGWWGTYTASMNGSGAFDKDWFKCSPWHMGRANEYYFRSHMKTDAPTANVSRPWFNLGPMQQRTGVLSYREAIAPNTEVTTIMSNHFNPLSAVDGGESLNINGEPHGWDYFFVSYAVFNQSVGIEHDTNLKQDNGSISFLDESGIVQSRPDFPLEPWTGQPLHD